MKPKTKTKKVMWRDDDYEKETDLPCGCKVKKTKHGISHGGSITVKIGCEEHNPPMVLDGQDG